MVTIDIRKLMGKSSLSGVTEPVASAIRIAVWAALGPNSTREERAAAWGPLYEQFLTLSPEEQREFMQKFNKKASI